MKHTMTTPQQIVTLLREASYAYYNGGESKMDDESYDALVERLKQMDPEHPYLDEVGAPPPQGAVNLPYPMPSLDKIKPGEDSLKRFLTNAGGFVLSEKLDGLSALWYKGKLYLRGDGLVGQDISHLVGIKGLGKPKVPMAIRGELVVSRSEIQTLARSWVNGQIHQDTPDPVNIAKIHFVAYELMGTTMKRSQQFEWLAANGFEVPWYKALASVTEPALAEILQERRQASPYDTDGIVVGLDTVPKSESTAAKAKNPKDCVAFKMPLADQSAETTVREVLWAPSAQGYLIPRLRFDPVKIGGATIEFCTGHNARMIMAGKLGPGAKVVIRRSGDVIPKMDKVLIAAAEASFPPSATWTWDGDSDTAAHIKAVGGGADLVSAKLHYFLKTLEIPGAGPATATSLVEAGILGPAALWAATAAQLSKALGPKTGASLYANLRTVLGKVDELTLMHASSTMPRGVGDTKLKSLFAVEADPRKWSTVDPPAGWTKDSFLSFLREYPNYVEWRKKEFAWIPYPILGVVVAAPQPVTGETVCMTGFRDKALEEQATKRGHAFVPALTGKVTILLVPDGEVKESEKVKAARAKGTRILSRSQFVAQYLA
jgi:DNA ligase (NAD+)